MAKVINTTYPQYGLGGDFADATYKATLQGYQDRQNIYDVNTAGINAGYERLYNTQKQYGDYQNILDKQQFDRSFADMQQSLAARGLSNTSEFGIGSRGAVADYTRQRAMTNDQTLQRQAGIAQNELSYLANAQQGLSAMQGEKLGWMGNVQQNSQAQNFQGAMQGEQFAQQDKQAKDQFNYSSQASQQGFGNQYALAQQGFDNQRNYQREFGYYAGGGPVAGSNPVMDSEIAYANALAMAKSKESQTALMTNAQWEAFRQRAMTEETMRRMADQGKSHNMQRPAGYFATGGMIPPPSGSDTVPARLTPGEFVLSKDMIAALETGALDRNKLVELIRQGRMTSATPAPGYARGGFVPKTTPSDYLLRQTTLHPEEPAGGRYVPRGKYG